VSSARDNSAFRVEFKDINGVGPATASILVPNTGTQVWRNTAPVQVALDAGQHQMRIYFETAGTLLDYVVFTPDGLSAEYFEPLEISTNIGAAPRLPGVANAVTAGGAVVAAPVSWDAVAPASYAQVGSFVVNGTSDFGSGLSATVNVNPIVSVDPVNVRIGISQNLVMPAGVTVRYADGTSGTVAVTWAPINPADLKRLGTFSVTGAAAFTDIPVSATVKVVPYLIGTPNSSGVLEAYTGVANAFDDDTGTFFYASGRLNQNSRYIGLDLGAGNAQVIEKVRFYLSEDDVADLGGTLQIQGSNTSATAGMTVLATLPLPLSPGWQEIAVTNTTAWRYLRLIRTTAGFFRITELQFYAPMTLPYVTIDGLEILASGAGVTATYTISVNNLPQVSGIELEFELDGAFLRGKDYNAIGFDYFGEGNYGGPIYWSNVGDTWIGKVTLINQAGVSGDADILELTFDVIEGVVGIADVKLNYLRMSFDGVEVYPFILKDTATTEFVKWYSRYDVNRDGVVDLNDLTFALMYLMLDSTDPDWDVAKIADVNGDGFIDIDDLLLILANYTIPYYA